MEISTAVCFADRGIIYIYKKEVLFPVVVFTMNRESLTGANSKHWFTTSFLLAGKCRKAMLSRSVTDVAKNYFND